MKKFLTIIAVSFFVFACADEGPKKEEIKMDNEESGEAIVEKADLKKGMNIIDAWIRPAAKGRNTGLFFRVVNNSSMDDTLISAKSDIAKKVEVHETYKQGDMMGMREVDAVPIKAGESFAFKPMAHHVMLIQLSEDMSMNKTGEVTLVFKYAGEVKVNAAVKDKMPEIKAANDKPVEEVN